MHTYSMTYDEDHSETLCFGLCLHCGRDNVVVGSWSGCCARCCRNVQCVNQELCRGQDDGCCYDFPEFMSSRRQGVCDLCCSVMGRTRLPIMDLEDVPMYDCCVVCKMHLHNLRMVKFPAMGCIHWMCVR